MIICEYRKTRFLHVNEELWHAANLVFPTHVISLILDPVIDCMLPYVVRGIENASLFDRRTRN